MGRTNLENKWFAQINSEVWFCHHFQITVYRQIN